MIKKYLKLKNILKKNNFIFIFILSSILCFGQDKIKQEHFTLCCPIENIFKDSICYAKWIAKKSESFQNLLLNIKDTVKYRYISDQLTKRFIPDLPSFSFFLYKRWFNKDSIKKEIFDFVKGQESYFFEFACCDDYFKYNLFVIKKYKGLMKCLKYIHNNCITNEVVSIDNKFISDLILLSKRNKFGNEKAYDSYFILTKISNNEIDCISRIFLTKNEFEKFQKFVQ